MVLSTGEIVLNYVCPALGLVLANSMFLSPFKEVVKVRRCQALGETNPIPFSMIAINCFSWVIYGLVKADLFLTFSNMFGAVLGIFYTVSCVPYASIKVRDSVLGLWCSSAFLFMAAGVVSVEALKQQADKELLWGSVCVLALIVYYTAPLSTLAKVIRTRCSASIYWPLALLNAMNGGLWTAYGLAIRDWFIMVPNCLGVLVSVVALVLSFTLPHNPQADGTNGRPPVSPWLDKPSSAHELLSSVSSSRMGSGCGGDLIMHGRDQTAKPDDQEAAGTRVPHSVFVMPGDDVMVGTQLR